MIARVGAGAAKAGQNNVAFLSYFVLGNLEECLKILVETNRFPEAAFFARTYMPSELSRVVTLWRESLSTKNPKAAQSLANPAEYENLFPGLQDALKAEQFLTEQRQRVLPASSYPAITPNQERLPVAEMQAAEESGEFTYMPPPSSVKDDDGDKPAVVLDRSISGGSEVEGLPSSSAALEVDHVSQKMMSPPKPTVMSVAERHSPSPARDTIQPSSATLPPAPPAATAFTTTAVKPTPAEDATSKLDDLETELELDLENMKLDNIDTTGIETEDLDDWE